MQQGTIQRDQIYVYGNCQKCQEQNVLVYAVGELLLCAEDTRQHAFRSVHVPHCDKCGVQDKVVRDPSHRRNEYLCMSCHVENGFMIVDTVTNRVVRSTFTSTYERPARPKIKCYVDNHDCDDNIKPRGQWDGKMLCNKHGRVAPDKKKK